MATAHLEGTSTGSTASTPAARVAARESEPTIGALVNDALKDVSTLVRSEIQLAKLEVTADVKKGGQGVAFFAVAGVFAFLGLIFLLHTIAQAIAVWLPLWAGYLIVTALLFVGAGIAALVGKRRISKVKGKPERAIETSRETVEAVRRAAQS